MSRKRENRSAKVGFSVVSAQNNALLAVDRSAAPPSPNAARHAQRNDGQPTIPRTCKKPTLQHLAPKARRHRSRVTLRAHAVPTGFPSRLI